MDRFRCSSRAGFAAVRIASGAPLKRILSAEHERVAREPGADAAHRRAVSEDAVLRCAAHDVVAERTGPWGEPQAGGAADAGNGIAGHGARSPHQQAASGAREIPVFIARSGDLHAPGSVVCGHHVCAHGAWIHVSGGRDGLVQPLRARLGGVQQSGERFLRDGAQTGVKEGASRHLQHRPGRSIHERGVHGGPGPGRRAHQHGRTGPGARQCVHRTVVAQREVRGPLPARVCRWSRAACRAHAIFSLLQSRAPAQRPEQPHAGNMPHPELRGRNLPARFGAVPLRPCPSGSPPAADTACAARPQNVHPRAALLTIPEAPATLEPRGGLKPAPDILYYDILIRPGDCRKMGARSLFMFGSSFRRRLFVP